MAKIIGNSGAWAFICQEIETIGFRAENISDIEKIIEYEKKKLETEQDLKSELLEKETQDFSEKMSHLEKEYQKVVFSSKEKIKNRFEKHTLKIKHLRKPTSFFKKIKRRFQIAEEKRKVKALRKKGRFFFENLKRKKVRLEKSIEEKHKRNKIHIEEKEEKIEFNIRYLQKIGSSPDLFGAIAELELIKYLGTLPANYYIVNDVNLSARKWYFFDGKHRRTAQIDTMIISPAGIFVIEVKNWSKGFIEKNNYHDPYDQVKWAAYLCYIQTKVKTRSIIAHTGNIPSRPQGSYAKVLRLNEVKNYVLWFENKDKELSNERIKLIANSI